MKNLEHSFSMNQQEKLEEVPPTGWANITQILEISINLIYFASCVF